VPDFQLARGQDLASATRFANRRDPVNIVIPLPPTSIDAPRTS